MMGSTHALSGAAAWLALAAAAPSSPDASTLVAGAAVAAGWALLPDIDHPGARAARRLVGGRLAARGVAALAGGHRAGTHSLAAVLAVAAVAAVAALLPSPGLLAALVALGVYLTLRWLPRRFLWLSVASAVGVGLVVAVGDLFQLSALAGAVAVGYAAAVAGDALTDEGVPLLWPFSARRFRLSGLRTGGGWESVARAALVGVALLSLSALDLGDLL